MTQISRFSRKEIDSYNPDAGLKTIAVAEAAEKHFARARDAEQLFEAIETKLGEQRRFIRWWDAQEKLHGARRGNAGVTPLSIADVFGLDPEDEPARDAAKMMLSRWRKKLCSDESFEVSLAEARERCRCICEQHKGGGAVRGAEATGDNEWFTPECYIELARRVLGEIDLDPASHLEAQKRIQAKRYFTAADNGLIHEWKGRVWLNPPYAQPLIEEFVDKLLWERRDGNISEAIMVTNSTTDTAWFHKAATDCSAICFTRGRIKFENLIRGVVSTWTQGQAFFYFGDNPQAFCDAFQNVGFIVGVI